jgi:hypothetical protein
MLMEITAFINQLADNYNFNYELYLHPLTPPWKYVFTSSIPYEHFSKDGKWIISEEELLNVFEKELAKIKERNKDYISNS